MASRRQPDLFESLLAAYLALVLCLVLVLLVSPLFLAAGVGILAYRIYLAYRDSPARLAAVAYRKSLTLHAELQQLAEEWPFPDPEAFTSELYDELVAQVDLPPGRSIQMALLILAYELYDGEELSSGVIPGPPQLWNAVRNARYQDSVSSLILKLSTPETVEIARGAIIEGLLAFIRHLPPFEPDQVGDQAEVPTFTVRLLETCSDVGGMVEELLLPFYTEPVRTLGLFAKLREQLDNNLRAVSEAAKRGSAGKLLFPKEHGGVPSEIVSAYLRHTKFTELFSTELPFNLARRSRMEHWHLVAGSGHGKTQTLQHIIMRDLQGAEPPALIIIDSQGDMLRKIQRLALFEDSDRLVVIDPEDDHSPALNMFDVRAARLDTYSRAVREQVEAGIIELFNYVFGALASNLTAKQGTAFAYITRLMLSIPGATIHTFRELMETTDRAAFAEHIVRLDPTSRAFFDNQFFNRAAFGETRQQIARRLYTVLQVPAFERMFASPINKLDMFDAMQGRKVVLINTSKALLKTEASALFGRYMIALTLNAAFERVAVPEASRVPAYLIIDEAAEYFDGTLERLLAQARKFNLGVLFAHQHMDQLSPALRSTVAANTSIKMAGGLSDHDARLLAPDMRTSADFIGANRKRDTSTEFACYVRNRTNAAVRVTIPFGTLESAPQSSETEQARFVARNRARYAVPLQLPPPTDVPGDAPLPSAADAPQKPIRRDPDDVDMHATEI